MNPTGLGITSAIFPISPSSDLIFPTGVSNTMLAEFSQKLSSGTILNRTRPGTCSTPGPWHSGCPGDVPLDVENREGERREAIAPSHTVSYTCRAAPLHLREALGDLRRLAGANCHQPFGERLHAAVV